MNESQFWQIIEAVGDFPDEEKPEVLAMQLEKLPASEVIEFDRLFSQFRVKAYLWNLWGAAYLINGGCSDDGFEYFRCWLICQGQEVYGAALENPDSLADTVDPDEEYELEDVLYVPNAVYRNKTGLELPATELHFWELRQDWNFDDEDEYRRRLPRLSALYMDAEEDGE